ncbi:MAG: metallophosphoesterase [Proteobacteria bacterium]|nr:metallophosphoesterase [Pseudomonadota bacterium]
MNHKMFRFVLLSSVLALIGVSGCDSDAGAEKVGNPCTDACTPDEQKCDGDAVYACEKSEDTEDACYEWVKKETCSDGKHCDESTKKCADNTNTDKKCPEKCEEGQHCDESTGFECVGDEEKKCPAECEEGQHCDESTGFECVGDEQKQCPEDGCPEGQHCDESTGFECVGDEQKQCPEDGCPEGQHCDESTGFECVEPGTSEDTCPNACDPNTDQKKCDGEEILTCQKKEDAEVECYAWASEKTCDHGYHCDETTFECAEGCAETCDENALKRCSSAGLEQCTPDEKGCASWSVVDPCEGGKCDSDMLECIGAEDLCLNACDPTKDQKKCDGEDIYVCQKNEDAEVDCNAWVHETTCESGKHCDETTFTCIDGCTEICVENQSTRCSAEGLEQCKPDDKGCASWSVVDACEGGTCDSATLKCVKSCDNECTADEKKCDGNGIAKCTKDADGCLAWGTPAACPAGQVCDSKTTSCVATCTSNCSSKGKIEVQGVAKYRTCTDKGNNCLQWVETKCNRGEKFDAKQNKCVSVCGNDCEPFTIVFLPDSQEYTRKVKKNSDGKYVKSDGSINIFPDQLQWIKDNKNKYNIKAVIHLGDITDTNTKIAWQFNDATYASYIDGLNLPYTVAPGNHDFKLCDKVKGTTNDNAAVDLSNKSCNCAVKGTTYGRSATQFHTSGKFNQTRAKVKDRPWFKEYAADKTAKAGNSFITFKAAGIDFLVIAIEYAPRNAVITWANNVIKAHPNHKVIVETHSYLSPAQLSHCTAVPKKSGSVFTNGYSGVDDDAMKGFNNDANGGSDLYKKLIAKHNNIILVANGHVAGSCFRLNQGNNGNTVAEMAVDYQTEDGIYSTCGHTHEHGGSGTGWFRMLKFDPKNYTITAITTSSLGAKRFGSKSKNGENKNGKEWFYCKDKEGKRLYPADPKEKPAYRIDMDSDAHRFTNKHAFVANFDFVTPVDYIKP